jgi:hypothetical protein
MTRTAEICRLHQGAVSQMRSLNLTNIIHESKKSAELGNQEAFAGLMNRVTEMMLPSNPSPVPAATTRT